MVLQYPDQGISLQGDFESCKGFMLERRCSDLSPLAVLYFSGWWGQVMT